MCILCIVWTFIIHCVMGTEFRVVQLCLGMDGLMEGEGGGTRACFHSHLPSAPPTDIQNNKQNTNTNDNHNH